MQATETIRQAPANFWTASSCRGFPYNKERYEMNNMRMRALLTEAQDISLEILLLHGVESIEYRSTSTLDRRGSDSCQPRQRFISFSRSGGNNSATQSLSQTETGLGE